MPPIPLLNFVWCLPLLLISFIAFAKWSNNIKEPLIAVIRMAVQLLVAGSVLIVLFEHSSILLSVAVFLFMLLLSSWIAWRPVKHHSQYRIAIVVASGIAISVTLVISVTQILPHPIWYQANLFIPLCGMYFANVMNSLSLCCERYHRELNDNDYLQETESKAFSAAILPQINTLLAVGLVALPGMMTGQILAGESPLIAIQYQIMIMLMLFTGSSLAIAIFLLLMRRKRITG